MRVAVTGAGGRLGRAVVAALEEAPFGGPRGPIAWTRAAFDLDAPEGVGELLDRAGVEAVVHAAAWADVDGCARDPATAQRRNARATGVLAAACAARGIDLVAVSTNEVFDGRRTDGLGYRPDDDANPVNAYGASKRAGELAAAAAFAAVAGAGGSSGPRLGIVRTAWLFGPPGADFPSKILAAADRALAAGEAVRVVADEIGSPTYCLDLAGAIVDLIGSGDVGGIHHVVNAGAVSRAGWARELFRQAAVPATVEDVPASTWARASSPPGWAVLEPTPLPLGEALRPWAEALADYLPSLLRDRRAIRSAAPTSGR